MRRKIRSGAFLVAGALLLAIGCGSRSKVDALAMDGPGEAPAAADDRETTATAGLPVPAASAGDDGLDAFPVLGPVFPGLGGQVHSSACDPAIDSYGTCL